MKMMIMKKKKKKANKNEKEEEKNILKKYQIKQIFHVYTDKSYRHLKDFPEIEI